MPKVIINFSAGQYSPAKLKFKALFAKTLKWDGKQAWVKGSEYIRATEKMESGAPVSFVCEVNNDLYDKLIEFCQELKVHYQATDTFKDIQVKEAVPEFTFMNVKIDRAKSFESEMAGRNDYSLNFYQGWLKLLREDDERINNNLEKAQ